MSKRGKVISVIVPVYNAELYLHQCLNSISNQSYRNLEIICIDDGSSDASGHIVDQFAISDSRFVVKHQVNGGESKARNEGLKIASGDYIAFVDCDDWLEPDMYRILLEMAEYDNLDVAACSWTADYDNFSERIINGKNISDSVFSAAEALRYLYERDSYRGFAYMWNKLYSRELLQQANGTLLKFADDLVIGGDVLYLGQVMLNAKRIRYTDSAFYHYRQHEKSGCHTKNLVHLKDWLLAYERLLAIFQGSGVEKETIKYVKRFMAYHSSNFAEMAIVQGDLCKRDEFRAFMRKYQDEYIELNEEFPERVIRYLNLLDE